LPLGLDRSVENASALLVSETGVICDVPYLIYLLVAS
jgi:hypothetical protein